MRTVHAVVPDSLDDPARPSGGNTYDRRTCAGLQDLGWSVRMHRLPGRWPRPDRADVAGLARTLAALPRDSLVLVDGLVATAQPDVLLPAASRLRLVVLVHLPLGHPAAVEAVAPDTGATTPGAAERERLVLAAAAAVLTTSHWTADWLVGAYGLPADRVHVARPGVDRAPPATGTGSGTGSGTALLSVAAVVPAKGHTELLDALAALRDLPWRLVCAGPLDLARDHVVRLRAQVREAGLADRVRFTGALDARALDRAYAAADVLVVASRLETYGLVVTEALARALPVVATAVGGVEEALVGDSGGDSGGDRPGLLVRPGSAALAVALRSWLTDDDLRHRLRSAARARRRTLEPWSATALRVSDVLSEVDLRTAATQADGARR